MAHIVPTGEIIPYERVWVGKSRVRAIIALTHPMAVIIFSLLTLILAKLAVSALPRPSHTLPLVLAMAAVQASKGIFNEIFDRELDLRTKPWRAIPAGLIKTNSAALLALALLCLGLVLAFTLSPASMLLLFLGAGMGFLYSAKLKRTVLSWLPYVVAYPSLPVWVSVSLGRFKPQLLIIYGLAAPFAIAIHVCNQLRDFDEDGSLAVHGLVHHLGKPGAIRLCLLLLAVSPLPFLIMVILRYQPVQLLILLPAFILHWILTYFYLLKNRDTLEASSFRSLFRRLQITGPVMLVSWFWMFQAS